MIEILIFQIHIVAAIYAFTKNWQAQGVKEGLLGLAVFGLVFTIGWALTGSLAYYLYPKSWNTIYFNSDTFSLILLSVPEAIFFKYFFINKS